MTATIPGGNEPGRELPWHDAGGRGAGEISLEQDTARVARHGARIGREPESVDALADAPRESASEWGERQARAAYKVRLVSSVVVIFFFLLTFIRMLTLANTPWFVLLPIVLACIVYAYAYVADTRDKTYEFAWLRWPEWLLLRALPLSLVIALFIGIMASLLIFWSVFLITHVRAA